MKTLEVYDRKMMGCGAKVIATVKILKEFPILWQAWECDNVGYIVDSVGYIVDHNGETKLVTTNHGTPYFSDVTELQERIMEYKRVIEATREAISLLGHTA